MSVSFRYIAAGAAFALVAALSSTTALASDCCGASGGGGGGPAISPGGLPSIGGGFGGAPGIGMPVFNGGGMGGAGGAGGCGGGGGGCAPITSHPIALPPINVTPPKVTVGTPSVTVNQGNITVGGTTFISAPTQFTSRGGGQTTIAGGGGGYYTGPAPVTPGMIDGLAVEGGREVVREMASETYSEIVPIRAVCIDDHGMPHPASRVSQAPNVEPGYAGEIYRCMAGTRMEVTIGRMVDGKEVFDGGRAMSCAKGQALAHADGKIQCVAQSAQADCYERSLLRRFGPGIKFVTVSGTRQVERERVVERTAESRYITGLRGMIVDGGVGQGVY